MYTSPKKRLAQSGRPCSPQPSISLFVSILSPPGPGRAGLGLLGPGVSVDGSDRKSVKFFQRPRAVLCLDAGCDFMSGLVSRLLSHVT